MNDFLDLYTAMVRGNHLAVDRMLRDGLSLEHPIFEGRTALHEVAQWGYVPMLKVLIAHGLDVNAPTAENGDTPLHMAAWGNQAGAVKALIAAGASLTARTAYDEQPLHTAARRRSAAAVRALIEAGANVNATAVGGTPLSRAVSYGDDDSYSRFRDDVRTVRALLDGGADPAEALAAAVSSDNTLAIRALVRAGANPATVTPNRFNEATTRRVLAELVAQREATRRMSMTDRDFLNTYGYPASWDDEEPQPRQRPTPAAVAEVMLRDTACSSDELLFEGLGDD